MTMDPVVLVVMPGWETSEQAKTAIERMRKLGVTVYHGPDSFFSGLQVDSDSIFQSETMFWEKRKRRYDIEPDGHQSNAEKIDPSIDLGCK